MRPRLLSIFGAIITMIAICAPLEAQCPNCAGNNAWGQSSGYSTGWGQEGVPIQIPFGSAGGAAVQSRGSSGGTAAAVRVQSSYDYNYESSPAPATTYTKSSDSWWKGTQTSASLKSHLVGDHGYTYAQLEGLDFRTLEDMHNRAHNAAHNAGVLSGQANIQGFRPIARARNRIRQRWN